VAVSTGIYISGLLVVKGPTPTRVNSSLPSLLGGVWNRIEPDPEVNYNALTTIERDAYEIEKRFVGPSVRLRMAVHDGRPEVDEVKVERREGDPEITATTLSDIPLRQIADDIAEAMAGVALVFGLVDQQPDEDAIAVAGESALAIRRRRTITDELLREVAHVYESDTTGAPTKAVSDQLFTSHRNATRYVALARERGLLAPFGEETK